MAKFVDPKRKMAEICRSWAKNGRNLSILGEEWQILYINLSILSGKWQKMSILGENWQKNVDPGRLDAKREMAFFVIVSRLDAKILYAKQRPRIWQTYSYL